MSNTERKLATDYPINSWVSYEGKVRRVAAHNGDALVLEVMIKSANSESYSALIYVHPDEVSISHRFVKLPAY